MKTKKSSEEWQRLLPEIIILDPDGWDRANWQKSWHEELITEVEYTRRRVLSTCIGSNKTMIKNTTSRH